MKKISLQSIKDFHHKHSVITTLLGVFLLAGVGVGVYFGYRYLQYIQTPEGKFQHDAQVYKESYYDMMKNAGSQAALPKDEVPVLATVTDYTALGNQTFFQEAKNGDKIMMYKKHKLAFLYRPSEKKILAQAKLQYVDPSPTVVSAQVAGTSSAATKNTDDPTATQSGDAPLSVDKLLLK